MRVGFVCRPPNGNWRAVLDWTDTVLTELERAVVQYSAHGASLLPKSTYATRTQIHPRRRLDRFLQYSRPVGDLEMQKELLFFSNKAFKNVNCLGLPSTTFSLENQHDQQFSKHYGKV